MGCVAREGLSEETFRMRKQLFQERVSTVEERAAARVLRWNKLTGAS